MPSITERYYLGRVKRPPHRSESYHYATLEPLVESDPSGTEWLGPVRELAARFPRRGYVHWHDAPFTVQLNSVWQFTIDEHPDAERGDRSEQFQLDNNSVQEPIEVVDLSGWGDESALRSALTGDGIAVSPPPVARRILLRLASGLCVGPLLLKAGNTSGLYVVDAPEAHRDASRMPVWRLPPAALNRVQLEGSRCFVSPSLDLGQSAGIQNWTSDAQVARSILGRLRRMDPELVKAVGITDNLYREYLERVEEGRMDSVDAAVERARADRLRGVQEAVQRDLELLREAAEALLGMETVKAEIDRLVHERVVAEVQVRRAEIQEKVSDVAGQLATTTSDLARLEAEVDTKRTEENKLDAALQQKREELESKVAAFDQEVAVRLEAIAKRPEVAFAEAAIMRAVMASGLTGVLHNGTKNGRAVPSRGGSAAVSPGSTASGLEDQPSLLQALREHAAALALSETAIMSLHAAFAAGVTPVVSGSRGYDLLRAYASAVAGARLHWIPIASSMMEPLDLLGRFDGTARRIMPAASGLLDVVNDAAHSGRLHVVVLEGFNRAPAEAYLAPILEVALAGRAGDDTRAIPVASADLLAEEDPYRELARLHWPSTVLIACLATDGSVTLPVSRSVWRFLAVVGADGAAHQTPQSAGSGGGKPVETEASPELWRRLVSATSGYAPRDDDPATALGRALGLPTRDAADAARFDQMLRINGLASTDATALALTSVLIARSGGDAKTIEEAMRASGVRAVPDWRDVWTEAQRLRS